MLVGLTDLNEGTLRDWIESSIQNNSNLLSFGYQAVTYFYEDERNRLVIKVPPRKWWQRWLYLGMIRHEYNVYQRLYDITGIPRCYGLIDRQYLVLEYIEGETLREATLANREKFAERLLFLVKKLHGVGVAHADLKKKDNILIVNDDDPYLIDFGAAIIRKPGFRPLNYFLFNLAKKFDLNAWVKHKYAGRYGDVSERDQVYFERTFLERFSRQVKKIYRTILNK